MRNLVLARKCGEDVILSNRETGEIIATVSVNNIKGARHSNASVVMSFRADLDISVHRREVYEKIERQRSSCEM